jgi:ribosomal-protein-alanine N-acetyltransferase
MQLDGLPYAIEPMRLDDVPTVTLVEQAVFTMPWSSTAFEYELRHNVSSTYLVLRYLPWRKGAGGDNLLPRPLRRLWKPREDPSLLGYGGFWTMVDEAHICTLAVRQEWRGRGLGELLLASLVERAIERQASVVTLEVRVSNLRAQSLYTKYGFKTVGERKHYYSDNREDALIMTTDPVALEEYRQRLAELTARLHARLTAERDALPPTPPEA